MNAASVSDSGLSFSHSLLPVLAVRRRFSLHGPVSYLFTSSVNVLKGEDVDSVS